MIDLPFADRAQAGHELAEALGRFRGSRPLVLAVPRGAVPMARIIADTLHGDLDVVLVRKLGAPGSPEFAVGSVDEAGHVYVAEHAYALGIGERYLEQEKTAQMEVLRARRAQYTPVRPPIDPRDRVVIVVDDGIATGSTLIAAVRAIRARGPRQLIAAVAVAPVESLARLKREADDVVCLATPEPFHAVGQFFVEFPQVTDDEVVKLLQAAATSPSESVR